MDIHLLHFFGRYDGSLAKNPSKKTVLKDNCPLLQTLRAIMDQKIFLTPAAIYSDHDLG